MQELLVILAIVMLLVGGKKLPELGKGLGKAIRGFKQAEEETRKELQKATEDAGPIGEEEDPSTPRQDSGQADSGQAMQQSEEAQEEAETAEDDEDAGEEKKDEGTGEEEADETKGDVAT
jgi:sec-independent protein translocase protein TatA